MKGGMDNRVPTMTVPNEEKKPERSRPLRFPSKFSGPYILVH